MFAFAPSNKPPNQGKNLFTEQYENDDNCHPKTAYLRLLPPCQFALYLDDLFNLDLPIPINDAVPIFYRPLRRYFPIVRSSEWDSDPSGLILASDTAAEVSRWLESWRTVCSVRSAGSCTRTVSGIHIVRCLISTCRLSRIPVEVVRCLHGQQADSKPMIRHKISVLIRFRFGLVRPGRRPF